MKSNCPQGKQTFSLLCCTTLCIHKNKNKIKKKEQKCKITLDFSGGKKNFHSSVQEKSILAQALKQRQKATQLFICSVEHHLKCCTADFCFILFVLPSFSESTWKQKSKLVSSFLTAKDEHSPFQAVWQWQDEYERKQILLWQIRKQKARIARKALRACRATHSMQEATTTSISNISKALLHCNGPLISTEQRRCPPWPPGTLLAGNPAEPSTCLHFHHAFAPLDPIASDNSSFQSHQGASYHLSKTSCVKQPFCEHYHTVLKVSKICKLNDIK